MPKDSPIQPVIFTNVARCRDCYRCVRVCPVKAIRVRDGQASVDADRCIGCGTCVRECPQEAKTYRRDIDRVEEILAGGGFVAASLAPSFAGAFEPWEWLRIPAALRRLGFSHVAETAIGAYLVARETASIVQDRTRPHVCTACPAVVSYIEKYDPDRVPDLLPLVSPMMAHARHIKKKFGFGAKVVFIGPCAAKKMEADRWEFRGLVDAVLTFEELGDLLHRRAIDIRGCEESSFDEIPFGKARFFPVEGGALATSALPTDILDDRLIFVSGFGEVQESLKASGHPGSSAVIEPLMCPHGCVNGPGIRREGNPFERRARVIRYAQRQPPAKGQEPEPLDLSTNFQVSSKGQEPFVTEEKVREILVKTGKADPLQQLNCGACGYSSCRDQAEAVVRGMAELEMCMPYMRRLAEQRSDRIMETSPNAIVILDEQFRIISINPAFARIFRTDRACIGRHISHFVDPDPFERVASGETQVFDGVVRDRDSDRVMREVAYALKAEHQFVGIFSNITAARLNAERIEKIKLETIEQARELYAHQIEMAKIMANFLGDHTARGELLLQKLMDAVNSEPSLNEKKDPGPGRA
ncbi:MAG: 4Fe-4S binding protein [Elusimicrobia bacterium]|nr:4Fe-4S binding protein [Elusimicrobiota bacterium]